LITPYQYVVRSFRVIDGDTIAMELDLGFSTFTAQSCRLYGVDAPEHTTTAGKLVKAVIERWLKLVQTLCVSSVGWDKYANRFDGIVAAVNSPQIPTLNSYLLTQGLARPYSGGKKPLWLADELLAIENKANSIIQS